MTYKCIKVLETGEVCDGQVSFGTVKQNSTPYTTQKKAKIFQMILEVKDTLGECPKCHTSYFEWELKSS